MTDRLAEITAAAADAVREAVRLEALGGPRRSARARELRESAALWYLEAAQIAAPPAL